MKEKLKIPPEHEDFQAALLEALRKKKKRTRKETIMKTLQTIPLIIITVCVVAVIVAIPIMLLWNWFVPEVFGWKAIDFWQALALFVLCRLLFADGRGSKK